MDNTDIGPPTDVNHSLAALLNYQSPSPAVSSPLETSLSSLNEKDSVATPPDLTRLEDAPLSAAFLSDTTVADGQIFPPGAEFVKSWRMVNDGVRAWPDTTELVFVAGERLARDESVPQKVKIGAVHSDGEVDVWTGELKAPDATGRYVSYWRLSDGEGNFFGHSIWIDITVAELGRRSDGSSENSLGSSSIVMPQSAPVRSTAPSDVANGNILQQASSLPQVSPVTAASRLATDDAASDNGSDASSVSLISVPSSEDDIDQAEWEDSRSHVLVPSPARAGMEYVVLYDESSSDEE
jgi:next-to-BRCA1 protein 1